MVPPCLEAAVSWRAFLTDRQNPLSGLKPLELSWDALGGPQDAVLGLGTPSVSFAALQSWLGCGVEIYDPADRLVWWGWVEKISQTFGATGLESSLEDLANRAAVRYRSMEPGKDFGTLTQTAWKDEPTSQALYGIKERLLRQDLLSEQQALFLRDASLRRWALPSRRLTPSLTLTGIRVSCRGWFGRMRWRQWQAHTDILGHSPAQQGFQALGASLAQSFTPAEAGSLAALNARIRKIGNPQDSLRFQIRTDSLGQPGGAVLAEAALPASAISGESYAWVSLWLSQPCPIAAGQQHWLVILRDGAAYPAAYYSLGVDENLGFPGGKLLLLDASTGQWKPRSPEADLLFKLTMLSDSAELMARVAETAACFSGFDYEAGSGFSLPYVSESGLDCQEEFLRLLRLGTPSLENLLAWVTPKRRLRVFTMPEANSAEFWLGKDGRIKAGDGRNLETPWQAVGTWLRSETGADCFVENLRLHIPDQSYRLRTTSVDYVPSA